MDPKDIAGEVVDWIDVAQDKVQWGLIRTGY
jgi:hypothetical protein